MLSLELLEMDYCVEAQEDDESSSEDGTPRIKTSTPSVTVGSLDA